MFTLFLDSKVDINQRTTEDMLQQSSRDSQKREQQDRASIDNTTQSLFENQTDIKDRIERMDKEIQDLGEKVLEIPSLLADETKNDTLFYNDSIKDIEDENEDEDDENENGTSNDHIRDWIEKIDKNVKTEDVNQNTGFNFYNESVNMETDGDEDTVDDNGEHVIQWHSTPRGKSSRKSNLTDQSIII